MTSDEFDDALFEMSNIRKKTSGLPVNIYVSSGGAVNKQHGPRIKVMTNTGDAFNSYQTISIMLKKNFTADDIIGYHSLPSDVLAAVREYVNLNYDTLLQHWNDEIDSIELATRLKPLPGKAK